VRETFLLLHFRRQGEREWTLLLSLGNGLQTNTSPLHKKVLRHSLKASALLHFLIVDHQLYRLSTAGATIGLLPHPNNTYMKFLSMKIFTQLFEPNTTVKVMTAMAETTVVY
jgi:hypothetical protein